MTDYQYREDNSARVAIDVFDGATMPADGDHGHATVRPGYAGRWELAAHDAGIPDNLADAVARFNHAERGGGTETEGVTARWLRAFHSWDNASVIAFDGYSQGDYGYAVADEEWRAREIASWAVGDAYLLYREYPKTFTAADGETITVWRHDPDEVFHTVYGDDNLQATATELLENGK